MTINLERICVKTKSKETKSKETKSECTELEGVITMACKGKGSKKGGRKGKGK